MAADPPLRFTVNEAAVLAGLPRRRVDVEFERGVLRSAGHPKRLGLSALVYLRWLRGQPYELPVPMRKDVAAHVDEAVRARRHTVLLKAALMTVHLRDAVDEMRPLATRYGMWKAALRRDPDVMGGEATFANTRLTVRRVAALLDRGATQQELREDYPYLTEDDLRFAPLYVQATPRVGRPATAETPD